ncbi:MAG: hypothetical protein ACI835_000804 [Planctomycetota bacterium]|jgi:hypothetical protein
MYHADMELLLVGGQALIHRERHHRRTRLSSEQIARVNGVATRTVVHDFVAMRAVRNLVNAKALAHAGLMPHREQAGRIEPFVRQARSMVQSDLELLKIVRDRLSTDGRPIQALDIQVLARRIVDTHTDIARAPQVLQLGTHRIERRLHTCRQLSHQADQRLSSLIVVSMITRVACKSPLSSRNAGCGMIRA